ncbi:MAG: response regulator, partial [Myxococcota bacterium]
LGTGAAGLVGIGLLAGIWVTIVRRLADHVRLLTAEIATRQGVEQALERSRDDALQASRVKSDFVANMSHEIRTPMNGILGMTELLLRTTLSTRQRDYALTILRSGEALLGVLNDILDFSKIEAGKLSIDPVPFNLRLTLEDIADLLSPRSAEKGLEFIVRYDPSAPARVVGDPGRIRQIVTNLVGNAIKFTERGHVLVEVRSLAQPGDAAKLQIRVTDTGIGIPPDRLEAVFERFVQADGSTTRKHGGTGLGLTICRRLAELMGGAIGAESGVGSGSTFWLEVTLPIDRSEPAPIHKSSDLHGKAVLVVDDNPVNCQVVVEQLEVWGMRCRAVQSGRDALRVMRQAYVDGQPFDLAILDHAMPEMDGVMLAKAIKADPAIRAVRLVMLTSLGQRGDAREMESIGFLGYLMKPAREAQLLELVAAVLAADLAAGRQPLITRYTLDEQRTSPGWRPNGVLAPLKGRRVLLVEDNEVNRLVAVDLLAELGCTVDVAVHGAEAVAKSADTAYDVILMDCQMPVMDGWEATRAIRARERTSDQHTSIVALTANAMAGERERCVAGGMDDYLSKPVSLAALGRVIARYCGDAPTTGAPAEGPPAPMPAGGEAIDLARALTVTGGKVKLLRRVVDAFLADAPNRIAALEASVTQCDAGTAEREAHTLKGAASNLGAERFRLTAAKIEASVRSGTLVGLRPDLDALRSAFDEVRSAAGAIDWANLS